MLICVSTTGSPIVTNVTVTEESLTCSSSGGAAATVTWERNGVTLNDSDVLIIVTDTASSSYDSIVTNDGSGMWCCKVENMRGTSSLCG